MKYDFELNEWASNDSLSKIIKRLKSNSKILEFGCANGRLTKYMTEKLNCTVTIVEIDEEAGKVAAEYSKESFLGDNDGNIENLVWAEKLKGEKFDFIIFADVLEHLHDPEIVLKICKSLLDKNGSIIVSIPNIANNSILASLYKNEFEYQNIGLLDNTHIKFYTYYTFHRMLGRLEYRMTYETATFSKIGENELPVSLVELPMSFRNNLIEREFGDVYQFIFQFVNGNEGSDNMRLESDFPKNAVNYYESVYYMKHESEQLSEHDTCRFVVNLGRNVQRIDLRNKNVTGIRFDPINTNCIIEIIQVKLIDNENERLLEVKNTNALSVDYKYLVFADIDPFIEIDIEGEGILEIEFILHNYDLDNRILEVIENNIHKFKNDLEGITKNLTSLYEEKNKNLNLEYNDLNNQYNLLKEHRENDLINFEQQAEIINKNNQDIVKLNDDIEILNKEIENLRTGVNELQNENTRLQELINTYNSKFYHLSKLK